jgi:thiosulfate reductase cytochrome b subunit
MRENGQYIYRHTRVIRLTHWFNAFCLFFLLLSGLQIFNAHPELYFGNRSEPDRAVLALEARQREDGKLAGVTRIGSSSFDTTGLLGASEDAQGNLEARGFPSWLTIPSYRDLATGRRWHFFFAWLFVLNGLVYLTYSFGAGHLRRDLLPSLPQLKGIGHDIYQHVRLRFPQGDEARHYNVLQKLAYLAVVLVILPLVVLTGLTMSPAIDAAFPFLLDVFGGRQSARTIHFLCAFSIVVFVLVHIVMVLISGVWNNLRSMITGRYRISQGAADEA